MPGWLARRINENHFGNAFLFQREMLTFNSVESMNITRRFAFTLILSESTLKAIYA